MKSFKILLSILLLALILPSTHALVWYQNGPYWQENNQQSITINLGDTVHAVTNTFYSGSGKVSMTVDLLTNTGSLVKNLETKTVDTSQMTGFETIPVAQSDYQNTGTYYVRITLSDDIGSQTNSLKLIVNPQSKPLTLSANANPTNGYVPLTVQFTATPSGGTAPYTYSWDFGDLTQASTSQNPTHIYGVQGQFTATVVVTDSAGATAMQSFSIAATQFVNQPPVAVAVATPQIGNAPLTVQFSSLGSNDPDGTIASYSWDFGDSTASNSQNPQHVYAQSGMYVATLTVTDNNGATGVAQVVVTVNPSNNQNNNSTLTANAGQSQTGCTGTTFAFDGSASTGNISYYNWNFGDGSNANGKIVSHQYSNLGTYTVILTVTDNTGATAANTTTATVSDTCSSSSNQNNAMPVEVDKARIDLVSGNEFTVMAGSKLNFSIKAVNEGSDQNDLQLSVINSDLNILNSENFDLAQNSVKLQDYSLNIPANAKAGTYLLKLTLTNNKLTTTNYVRVNVLNEKLDVQFSTPQAQPEQDNWLYLLWILGILVLLTGIYFTVKNLKEESQ